MHRVAIRAQQTCYQPLTPAEGRSMYEMYHSEDIENAFRDIDSLIATGEPAW